MKRTIMVEIDADDKDCDGCECLIYHGIYRSTCGIYKQDLSRDRDEAFPRCAQCIEAEKKFEFIESRLFMQKQFIDTTEEAIWDVRRKTRIEN